MSIVRIFPSLIAADLLNLEQAVRNLDPHCDGFHIDIMDNHFVPNLTLGPLFANALDAITTHPSWIHLMTQNPETLIQLLTIKPKSIISFHEEARTNIKKTIDLITKKGWIASIAIKPSTPLEHVYPYLSLVNHILLMSVEPGFSGQSFIHESLDRLKHLVMHRAFHKLTYTIGIDGGINTDTISDCVAHGATDFAIASAIFSHNNSIIAVKELYKKTLV